MMIVPTINFCSECSEALIDYNIVSGNTFGGEFWTDGICIAPMWSQSPTCALCPNCKSLIWLDELEYIEPEGWYGKETLAKYPNAQGVIGLTTEDYIKVLDENQFPITKELHLRETLWHTFNDSRRDKSPVIPLSNVEVENLKILATLLDENSQQDILEKVEVFRELSEFSKARELLHKVTDTKLSKISVAIKALIEDKNPFVAKVKL